MYHVVKWDSLAIKFGRVKITFISALFYWLKRLTDEHSPLFLLVIFIS